MSTNHFLTGKRIYLRKLVLEDVEGGYHRWMNDPQVTHFLESRFRPSSKSDLRSYVESVDLDKNSWLFAGVLLEDDRHIGNIKLGPVNWIHRVADIGLLIGEQDCWGKGFAGEMIDLVVDFAFSSLNLHKVTASCYGNHEASASAFKKSGFSVEGTRKEQFYCDGEYVDMTLLGLIRGSERED